MRELQHFDDASQTTQSVGVPLLRVRSTDTEGMSEMSFGVCLFFWRRLRKSRRAAAKRIRWRAHWPAGPGHGTHKKTIPGNARRVCQRRAGYSGRHANAGEGT